MACPRQPHKGVEEAPRVGVRLRRASIATKPLHKQVIQTTTNMSYNYNNAIVTVIYDTNLSNQG